MGGSCSTYGGQESDTGFWWGKLRDKDHLKDPGLDGKIILRRISWKWDGRYGLD
jgi:hypothetical protein